MQFLAVDDGRPRNQRRADSDNGGGLDVEAEQMTDRSERGSSRHCLWTVGADENDEAAAAARRLDGERAEQGDGGGQMAASGRAGPVDDLQFNETVMKCIESCDKVLMRHSTAIR
jgi:hypothetical protein